MGAGGLQIRRFFLLASVFALLLPEVEGCRVGQESECEKAPFIPGHNLAGEGFDVVRMRRTGKYIINVNAPLSDNRTCMLCPKRFHAGQVERLPAAVFDWRLLSYSSKHLTSTLYHSVDSLLRNSSSMVNNDWGADLSLGRAVVAGSRSDMAKFARSQRNLDKVTFAIHEISSTYYSYRLADHPQLSTEFSNHLKRLRETSGSPQNRALYRRLIDMYGTHYIHKLILGGKVKRVTAFRTCLATLNGFSDSMIKNCLDIKMRMSLGFLLADASSNECDDLLEGNLDMGFYQEFMTHKIEVTGGERHFLDSLHNQEPLESYHSWLHSLHDNPDVVSYTIFPLHHLVEDQEVKKNLKNFITDYIKEHQDQEDHPGSKNCPSTPNRDHNCCPLRAGRGALKLEIRRAADLWGDRFGYTDAYVKIFYKGINKETTMVLDDNNPVWNAMYDFGSVELGNKLQLEVWDSDPNNDDFLGSCWVFAERGTHSMRCELDYGVLYFSYTTKCDPHLTGYRCGDYSPNAE